ncbi:hypothetical protein BDA96_01G101200 [Sorghum bicolor]|uniref:Uncharacterized protein n=2 Tax=Sorghum bicolor TaxID=4558 RepID=A0A921UXQ2_SORBI|nr:hypothetical protein BDA96_01G101200 [Sorghum bicolor]OQU91025.1 hypothetical protein SORBI_3001G096833 [Sorghum bicolor]
MPGGTEGSETGTCGWSAFVPELNQLNGMQGNQSNVRIILRTF